MTETITGLVLDLDVGNTRIKWRLSENGQHQHGFFLTDELAQEKEIEKSLSAISQVPKRVRISSVVGGSLLQQIFALCESKWQLRPEVAKVEEVCAGVTQAYAEKDKLGVDRWLGLLAAHKQQGDCVVLSCGSAVTVDVLADNGKHQGGYIVPGLTMMLKSLYQGTDAVKVSFKADYADLLPGRSTEFAVNKGVMAMVVGLVNQASEIFENKMGRKPKILITGGDGETVQPFIGGDTIYNPYLVFDGLALALP